MAPIPLIPYNRDTPLKYLNLLLDHPALCCCVPYPMVLRLIWIMGPKSRSGRTGLCPCCLHAIFSIAFPEGFCKPLKKLRYPVVTPVGIIRMGYCGSSPILV
jgi:hypothetical protein